MYQQFKLDNGLRLIASAMPHTRAVSVNFFVGAGSRYETDGQAGVSHFIEHVCFKGTEKRPTPVDISTVIEGVGGILNAGTDKEMTVYWCKVPQPHFHDALDVLADILLNAKFDPTEIEKERQVIVEEINMSLDYPAQRVSMLIDELLWPGHVMGRDIAGSRESVTALTRDVMLAYLAERYQPDNVVLSIAGNIDSAGIVDAVNRVVGGWKTTGTRQPFAPYVSRGGRAVRIENRDTEQTQLCLALPGVGMTDPDRFKLDMLNVILGEGMSSRLFVEIRDNLGLAYGIQSYAEHFLDTGAITVAAGVDAKNLKAVVAAILEQLSLFKDGVPEADLAKAKELFKGRIWLRMEDSRSVAGWAGAQEIMTGKVLTVDDVIETVEAITTGELRDVARRLFTGDQLRLAVVGPVDPDEPLQELLKL